VWSCWWLLLATVGHALGPTAALQGRALARLKGLPVVAVAWAAHACTESAAREVIVGTAAGTLFHLELHAAERTERLFKQLFELGAAHDKLQAMHLEVRGGGAAGEAAEEHGQRRYTLLAVTATRLFVFTGGSLTALFLPAVTVRSSALGRLSSMRRCVLSKLGGVGCMYHTSSSQRQRCVIEQIASARRHKHT
jgi:hypothetical protein